MPSRRTFVISAALLPFALAAPVAATAGSPRVRTDDGLAIGGADAVGYFTEGRAVAGSIRFPLMWGGATWLFASAENRARFEADPSAYAPRYGGYCAWAVSQGYTAPADPAAFTIHEGRLYLNYSKGVRQRFQRGIEAHIARANANWPAVLGE